MGKCNAATIVPGCGAENAATVPQPDESDPALDRGDWNSVRGRFVNASTAGSECYRALPQGIDADPVDYLEPQNNPRTRAAREAAARYTSGSADDIALTDSTTMGIGLVYNSLALRAGDDVVTTVHDYYSAHEALRQVAERSARRFGR